MPAYRSEALIDALRHADAAVVSAVLADSVTFNSPVATYTERADVVHLLVTIGRVLDEVRASDEFHERDRTVTLVTAAVGEQRLDGALIQTAAADGRLAELTLLLRPLAGLVAAVERMAEELHSRPLRSEPRGALGELVERLDLLRVGAVAQLDRTGSGHRAGALPAAVDVDRGHLRHFDRILSPYGLPTRVANPQATSPPSGRASPAASAGRSPG